MRISDTFSKTVILKILAISIGTLALLSIAIINGYPLITQDSAAYLNMAYAWFFPSDRPAFYGIFIRAVSVTKSIWWPVIIQSLIVSFLMVQLIHQLGARFSFWKTILMIGLVVLLTPVTWIVSQITADIFIAIAAMGVLLFYMENRNIHQWLYGLIIYFSLLTHNSNTLSLLCFATVMLIIVLVWQRKLLGSTLKIAGISVLAFFTLCTSNYYTNDEFTFSKASHVFLMGKMVESGMLKQFLDENCDQHHYALCAYKDSLPPYAADFIWQEGKAFHKTGGWHGSKEEYSLIIEETFKRPKYLAMHLSESVKGTIKQVSLTYVGDLLYPFVEGTSPYLYIQQWLPNEIPGLLKAKQQNNQLHFGLISIVYEWTLLLSVLVMLYFLIVKIPVRWRYYVLMLGILILANAFITATFANVIGRLNARLVWVLPFFVFIWFVRLFGRSKINE